MTAQSFLFIRLRGIGEVVMLLPLVDLVLSRQPDAEIEFVTKRPCEQLLERDPRIHAVHVLESKAWRQGHWLGSLQGGITFLQQLRQRRYDLVVDFHGSRDTQWLARACLGRRRVGRASARWSDRLLHQVWPVRKEANHNTDQLAAILRAEGFTGALGPARLHVGEEAAAWAEGWLHQHELQERRLMGLNPGAAFAPRQWPAGCFAVVGRELVRRYGAVVVVHGGPGEQALVQETISLIGEGAIPLISPRLDQLAALCRCLEVLVSNDTGPMHVAAAVGTRVVGIFGSTRPEHSGPYKASRFFPVRFAEDSTPGDEESLEAFGRRTLESITPNMVLKQIEKALAASESGGMEP